MTDEFDAQDEIAQLQDELAALRREKKTLESRIETLEQHNGTNELDESTAPTIGTGKDVGEQRPNPKQVIEDACNGREDGISLLDVRVALLEAGYNEPEGIIKRLRRQGDIYNPKPDIVKVV